MIHYIKSRMVHALNVVLAVNMVHGLSLDRNASQAIKRDAGGKQVTWFFVRGHVEPFKLNTLFAKAKLKMTRLLNLVFNYIFIA